MVAGSSAIGTLAVISAHEVYNENHSMAFGTGHGRLWQTSSCAAVPRTDFRDLRIVSTR